MSTQAILLPPTLFIHLGTSFSWIGRMVLWQAVKWILKKYSISSLIFTIKTPLGAYPCTSSYCTAKYGPLAHKKPESELYKVNLVPLKNMIP